MADEKPPYKSLNGAAPGFCSKIRPAIIEFCIFITWLCLEIANVVLHVLFFFGRVFKQCAEALSPTRKDSKHVVIVGASFGGLTAQRELSGLSGVKVTLVDFKKYFEYTPGVLRCFVEPSWLKQLTCPLPSTNNELVTAAMVGTAFPSEAVMVRDSNGTESELPFDYLILATGSTYADPIKPIQSQPTLVERGIALNAAAAKLEAATKVIVIGAGAVGIELVGEILTAYPNKHVVVVDFAKSILPGFDEAASSYTLAWLEQAGVELMLGTAIDKIEETSILLKSGETLAADVVYKCVGVMPNTGMLKGSPYEGKGFRDSVEVNDYLQVEGHPNVYCVGDMMSHTSRELKLGHTAEINAHMAAHNIAADLHGKPLGKYPRAITGADWSPKIYCLSLGKYDAVASLNGLILTGWYVAVLKWLLEWTKVAAAGERPVGVFFWWFADNVSNYMSRTLLPPPGKEEERDVVESLSWLHDVGMLPLRIITASLMVHHGLDKLQHVEGFSNNVIAVYFPFLPGPPEFWTYLSASFEIGGSICLVLGLLVRPAACLLAGTMVNAVAFQLMKNGLQGWPFGLPPGGPAYTFEPALAFLAVSTHIAMKGPGQFALQPHFPPLQLLKDFTPRYPMLKYLEDGYFAGLSLLILRVVTASLMVHHGLDKLQHVEGFSNNVIAVYFPFLPGPPEFWTYLSASFELGGSFILVVGGIFVRPAALLLMGTMVNAVAFQLMANGLQGYPFGVPSGGAYTFEPSLAFFGVTLYIALAGPGGFSCRSAPSKPMTSCMM